MQNNAKRKKMLAPILCAVIMIAVLLAYLVIFLYPVLGAEIGDAVAIGVLVISALCLLAVIGGVVYALYQRLKEIEGGEEDAASQY